ncbi:MAG: Arc family DNA-binding protein [Mesorhizobium sp.]|uniref:Arc family DNA-binding protein n=1 Tax=Mesorhizobium sp. TaxID=1871066 RepID=UPI001AC71505|nr:Arc family DNA-binding protein [Mesorhizobium sp.]MBN9219230.1 Arc family DNA-binding protein [Mesorhizobium sp.]
MAKRVRVRDQDQFIVRLPDGMRTKIAEAAQSNDQSMNAEIVSRLEASFDPAAALSESEAVREVLGKYIQATEAQNDALRKAGVISEQLIEQFARAISKAASGDEGDLKGMVEREKTDPIWGRIVTVWSIVGGD